MRHIPVIALLAACLGSAQAADLAVSPPDAAGRLVYLTDEPCEPTLGFYKARLQEVGKTVLEGCYIIRKPNGLILLWNDGGTDTLPASIFKPVKTS